MVAAAALEQSAESSPLYCWWMGGWIPAHQCSQLAVKEVLWGAEVAVVLLVWEQMQSCSAVTRAAAVALQKG